MSSDYPKFAATFGHRVIYGVGSSPGDAIEDSRKFAIPYSALHANSAVVPCTEAVYLDVLENGFRGSSQYDFGSDGISLAGEHK